MVNGVYNTCALHYLHLIYFLRVVLLTREHLICKGFQLMSGYFCHQLKHLSGLYFIDSTAQHIYFFTLAEVE